MSKYVLTGVNFAARLELQAGLNRLGRNPTNDFRIGDASVSSFHCEVEVERDGISIHDLGSTNGTFIDGEPVTEAIIKPGQHLKVGAVEFMLEEERDEYVPAAQPRILLPDGQPACLNHAETYAQLECNRCLGCYCDACVRILRRTGGNDLYFCPNCGGNCIPIPGAPQRERPTTLFARLTQTIRLKKHP